MARPMKLIWDNVNIEHIAKHRVEPEEVEEAIGDPNSHLIRSSNKHRRPKRIGRSRRKTSRYQVIGQTIGGRYLTIFVDKEPSGFYVVTAMDSSDAQIRLYWRHK